MHVVVTKNNLYSYCSMNPDLDIGQIEGAFVMGSGYYLTEKIRYDPQSGENLSASTWVCQIYNIVKVFSFLLAASSWHDNIGFITINTY